MHQFRLSHLASSYTTKQSLHPLIIYLSMAANALGAIKGVAGGLKNAAKKLLPKGRDDNREEKAEDQSGSDGNDLKEKLGKYVAKPEVKELYSAIKVSAQVIDGAGKMVKFLSKPEVKDLLVKRLPAIATKLAKLTQFASLLGPAGAALGIAVDLLAAFGLLVQEDPVMEKLNEILSEIKDLRADMMKGFEELKTKLDSNLALTDFLHVINKLQSSIEIFELNIQDKTTDPNDSAALKIWSKATHHMISSSILKSCITS